MSAVVVTRPGGEQLLLVGSWYAYAVSDGMRRVAHNETERSGYAPDVRTIDINNGARTIVVLNDGMRVGVLETMHELGNATDARQLEPQAAERAS